MALEMSNETTYTKRSGNGVRADLKNKCKNEELNSIYGDVAELIGFENARLIFNEYLGQQITFPVEFYSKEYIYSQICKEYDGTNAKKLAFKYNYSERTIRRIVTNKNK